MFFLTPQNAHKSLLKVLLITFTSALLLLGSKNGCALEIIRFYDGDTVRIKDGAYEYKLRLIEIDAPERNQEYGIKSRRALMQFCENTQIQVYFYGVDKYKRKLGKLHCNSFDANHWMVENGHAWFYKRFSMNYLLDIAQQNAKQEKLGLWQSEHAQPPWQWRKMVPRYVPK